MSWAAMARKVKDVPAPVETEAELAAKRVVAVDPKTAAKQVKFTNALKHTTSSLTLPKPQKGCLVLDANAFIKGLDDYVSAADVLVTTPQVLDECKDKVTRDLLERLPVELIVLDPSTDAIHKVVDVASATGDLGALSRTDIRLCALGLDVAAHFNVRLPPVDPRGIAVNPPEEDEDEEEEILDEEADADSDDAAVAEGDDGFGGSDGEGEWITPVNIQEVSEGAQAAVDADVDGEAAEANSTPFGGGAATATSDFPMQNVLLHLGVPIVGPKGMRIRELRHWLLRCHACFCVVMDTTKQFCPECGSGDTLKRVSYTVNELGERKLNINFAHHLSTRGTKYSLPKPRGGRNGTNRTLVLREDQLADFGRSSAAAKRRAAAAAATDVEEVRGFGEVRAVRRTPMAAKNRSSYTKYNINEKKKIRAARRK